MYSVGFSKWYSIRTTAFRKTSIHNLSIGVYHFKGDGKKTKREDIVDYLRARNQFKIGVLPNGVHICSKYHTTPSQTQRVKSLTSSGGDKTFKESTAREVESKSQGKKAISLPVASIEPKKSMKPMANTRFENVAMHSSEKGHHKKTYRGTKSRGRRPT